LSFTSGFALTKLKEDAAKEKDETSKKAILSIVDMATTASGCKARFGKKSHKKSSKRL